MSLLNWIFDIYQHTQIDAARQEAMEARREAARIHHGDDVDTNRLERALDELALASKTLQRLLVDKGVCTAEEFRRKLHEIDAEDGQIDGRSSIDADA